MKDKTLIIVDVQRDFYHPSGSLYVKGGMDAMANIADFIIAHTNELAEIIATVDWHPYNIDSFKEPNISWPVHCGQFSEGAGIADKIVKACYVEDIPLKVFVKGNAPGPHTEYGAFEHIGVYGYDNGDFDILVNNRAENSPLHIKNFNVIVCGIAGDYCVMHTIENLMKYDGPGTLDISVFKDGIASIDGGTTINEFIKENNLKTI